MLSAVLGNMKDAQMSTAQPHTMTAISNNEAGQRLADLAWSMNLNGVCITPETYAKTAVPEWIWCQARRIFVQGGLFAPSSLDGTIPGIHHAVELPLPHPNLQERFFSLGSDGLISNVIGHTRLLHTLVLLRLLGVSREQLHVVIERTTFSAEYRQTVLTLTTDKQISNLVLTFNPRLLAEALKEKCGGALLGCSSPLLKAVLVQSSQAIFLLVHITSVYGTQCVDLVATLRKHFDLQRVFLFGACGALAPERALNDCVLPRLVFDLHRGTRIAGNLFLDGPDEKRQPLGTVAVVADAASAACIPGERAEDLRHLAKLGIAVVDLELGPLTDYVSRDPDLRWGATLRVSDRPLSPGEQLPTREWNDAIKRVADARAQADLILAHARVGKPAKSASALSWRSANGGSRLEVWETTVPSRSREPITIHALPLDLSRCDLLPVVNSEGQGVSWRDDIVRGMRAWDSAHMESMRACFRRSPYELTGEMIRSNRLLGIVNGNGNLFWNLGHFVCLNGAVFHHVREHLAGVHTALISDGGRARIGAVDVSSFERSSWAVSGIRVLRGGDPVDLLETDPETGRPVAAEFYGDLSHIVRGFRLSLGFARRLFDETADCLPAEQGLFHKSAHVSPWLRHAVSGLPVTCSLDDGDERQTVLKSCHSYGYREVAWGAPMLAGDFALDHAGHMAIAPLRATLGHSLLVSTTDPDRLILVNTYTDASRKGFTIEDTADLSRRVAQSLGYDAREALLLSSSGDPRIILNDRGLECLEHDTQGQRLLFKGGLDYGLSNMLLVCEK